MIAQKLPKALQGAYSKIDIPKTDVEIAWEKNKAKQKKSVNSYKVVNQYPYWGGGKKIRNAASFVAVIRYIKY